MASALVNLQMLGYMVVAYLVLHFFFAEQFYHNPLKRGRGPTSHAACTPTISCPLALNSHPSPAAQERPLTSAISAALAVAMAR